MADPAVVDASPLIFLAGAGFAELLQLAGSPVQIPRIVAEIYGRFAPRRNLVHDFRDRFGDDIDEEALNENHQIIIVAASLDDSTERIIGYLSDRDIPINVLCFQVFTLGTEQLLCRTWLVDPVHTQTTTATGSTGGNEPWNGEFYANFGCKSDIRSCEEAVQHGFICAGGGAFYSRTLRLLGRGDRVWVNVPGYGFVGAGRATGRSQPAADFEIGTPSGDVRALEHLNGGTYHREFLNDPERCEYFVPVHWLQTVPLDRTVRKIGLFGNQNTVCKPTSPKWRYTVERLKKEFPDFDKE